MLVDIAGVVRIFLVRASFRHDQCTFYIQHSAVQEGLKL